MTMMIEALQSVAKKAGPDIRARLRESDELNRIYATTTSFKGQTGNVSAVIVSGSADLSSQARTADDLVSFRQAAAFSTIYAELQKQAVLKWGGATAVIVTDAYIGSPSSYPVTPLEYIGYLETAKKNLESRVSELETRLNDIQVYWPTMKKLLDEYRSATTRVEGLVKDLTAKYGSRSALEMAKRRDVLDKPAVEFLAELE